MVLCFQEEFKLFYIVVPAPSNRQILLVRIDTPPPTKHTNSFCLLCIYWPKKKENLDILEVQVPQMAAEYTAVSLGLL